MTLNVTFSQSLPTDRPADRPTDRPTTRLLELLEAAKNLCLEQADINDRRSNKGIPHLTMIVIIRI